MSLVAQLSSKIRQSCLKWLAVFVLLAALISALWVNFGIRSAIEARNKTVGLVVDYDELMRIADGAHDINFADMLRKAALSGATGLVVRERLLGEWETAGDVMVFTGGQLGFQLETQYGESVKSIIADMNLDLSENNTYILTKDPLVFDQIFSLLKAKTRYPESFSIPGYMGIAVQLHSSERATLGFGFPLAQLEEAAAAGYQVIPRLRNWEPVTADSLNEVFRWVEMIPGLAAIGFNDQTVLGDGTNPIIQDRLADAMAPLGKPLVSFEFYDQVGLPGLASRLDNNILRAHAIADIEVPKYIDFRLAMDRYSLAATERNIRYIYLRFQGLINPAASMLNNLDLIAGVKEGLIADGLIVGNPEPISEYTIGYIPMFLLGTGVIVAGAWLLALVAEPFIKRKLRLLYGILVVVVCLAWAALLFIAPSLSRKALSLAGAIVFPSLSTILAIIKYQNAQITNSRVKRALYAIGLLIAMTLITFAGALIISAILAEPTFMLRLDIFRGTKVAHIVPLVLVPFILWLREEDWYGIMSGTVKSSVKFWQLFVGIVLLAGLAVYILRTGNESAELVSEFEVQVRQTLKNLLGVRPRTKEFLIGHPFMMIMMYYGYKLNRFPLLMAGLIGQVSVINTYAHLHTPLIISITRSATGLWTGIIIGVIAIIIIELFIRRVRKLNGKYLLVNKR